MKTFRQKGEMAIVVKGDKSISYEQIHIRNTKKKKKKGREKN